jgi:hypothetical protein
MEQFLDGLDAIDLRRGLRRAQEGNAAQQDCADYDRSF